MYNFVRSDRQLHAVKIAVISDRFVMKFTNRPINLRQKHIMIFHRCFQLFCYKCFKVNDVMVSIRSFSAVLSTTSSSSSLLSHELSAGGLLSFLKHDFQLTDKQNTIQVNVNLLSWVFSLYSFGIARKTYNSFFRMFLY